MSGRGFDSRGSTPLGRWRRWSATDTEQTAVPEKIGARGSVLDFHRPSGGAFEAQGLPEIVDFGVLEKYRRRGIGTLLMDAAEQIAGEYADTVGLAVGLHAGYGSAQRMYVKRGYLPDGSGVWYANRHCEPYREYPNDDSLMIFLSKKLR